MRWKVCIDPFVYPIWAFLMLAVPFKVLCGWVGAVVFHEFGHIAAQCALGGMPRRIIIRPTGAVIEGEDLGVYRNIICVLAGPAAGAVPMIFMRSFPEIVLISFLLTIYNLLPLYPLDGGRVLRLMGERSRTVRTAASVVEIIFLACLLWVFVFWHTAVPLFPVIPYVREKYLAKRRNSGYNRATTEVR